MQKRNIEREKAYYLKNRERLRLLARKWASENKEKRNIARRKRYAELRSKGICPYKPRKYIRGGYYHRNRQAQRELKQKILEHYGQKCFCCGESTFRLLNVDHINNNGKEHKGANGKKLKGSVLYRFLIDNNYPEGIQIACFNCNIGRQINGGICPHKGEKAII